MSRTREIKPGFFLDEELAQQCSRDARLLFIGLWTLADCDGLMEDRPARIKAQLMPYDDDLPVARVDQLLNELASSAGRFVVRYEAAGKRYLLVRTLKKNQHFHPKEKPLGFPAPPAETLQAQPFTGKPEPAAEIPGKPPASNPLPSEPSVSSVPSESAGSSGARARDPGGSTHAPAATPPPNEPGKPTPFGVVAQFLAIRAALVVGSGVTTKGGLFQNPQNSDVQKASDWLAGMSPEECADIEPAIRLACQHVRDSAPGWNRPEMGKVGFLFGAIVRSWPDLREELHKCGPKLGARSPVVRRAVAPVIDRREIAPWPTKDQETLPVGDLVTSLAQEKGAP